MWFVGKRGEAMISTGLYQQATDTTALVVVSLVTSVIGGVVVAIINQLFARKRSDAEAEKLRAEAEKFRAEAQRIRVDIEKLNASFQQATSKVIATYKLEDANLELSEDQILIKRSQP